MSVIYILITVSIFVAVLFLIAFIKAVRGGQYDDDYTPSVRMLFDDEVVKKENPNKLIQTEKQKSI
ncbi:cbb3-type cytochrome oxidase assembly protein CcoS [Flavobacterium sp.]|jgi:cbb3-type cytochrome oxidase maturation protein|uniref:cbb3-type cytochrome oxidase assembly protein CcoS n=1 Tax=Flavobacterium sp. TaxID=239 RepID=UPI00404790B7